jgi:hypothetical protein
LFIKSLVLILILLVTSVTLYFPLSDIYALIEDIKCAVYLHSDDKNGDNVDVRIFVMGLKDNKQYTAYVIPDHNPPTSVTTKSNQEGTYWVIAKVPNGDKSLYFKVNVYEGDTKDGLLVASGEDDAPCYKIKTSNS